MSRVKRMQVLHRAMDLRQQSAARRLEAGRRELSVQQARLTELLAYREEYLTGYRQSMRTGFQAVAMQDYRRFLGHLERAVEQQRQLVAALATQARQLADGWRHEKMQARVMAKVVDRYRIQEAQHRDCREQRESDDRVARAAREEPTGE